jgi:hypothetical protein
MSKKINSISYSWTQPYNASMNPAYDNQLRVAQELLLLDQIDRQVEPMSSFPQVEEMLKKVLDK